MKKVNNPQTFTDHLNNKMVDAYLKEKDTPPTPVPTTGGELPGQLMLNEDTLVIYTRIGNQEPAVCVMSEAIGISEKDAKANGLEIVRRYNAFPELLEALKAMVNEFEIFTNIPTNYKNLPGNPGDEENPKLSAMLKAIAAIQSATK